mgnify:CR=1 FL=1
MELLTVNEATKLLRIDRKTLYKLIKRGEIPAIRLGSQWRIPKEALEKMISDTNNRNKKEE